MELVTRGGYVVVKGQEGWMAADKVGVVQGSLRIIHLCQE